MVVVMLIGGFQMLMLGVLGEYVWRGLDEARRRPRYTIEAATATSLGVEVSNIPNATPPCGTPAKH